VRGAAIEFIQLADERKKIFALHVVDKPLSTVRSEKLQTVLAGDIGLGLALGGFMSSR